MTVEVALSGMLSDTDYSLSIYSDGSTQTSTANPPLPLSASGSHNVRSTVQFGSSNCGSAAGLVIEVRRIGGVIVNEPYTLTWGFYRTMPGAPAITAISPTSGPSGTTVTITGDNLGAGPIKFISRSPDSYCYSFPPITTSPLTSIATTMPTCATTGPIIATTSYGGGQVPSPQIFTVTSETTSPTKKGGISPLSPDKKQPAAVIPGTTRTPSTNLPAAKLPPVQEPTVPGAEPCCSVVANAALKGQMGRVVVAFPDGAVPKKTRVDVLKNGKVVLSGYGNQSWELLPGTYEVSISGKRVSNVPVKAGHDTTVKIGVLRISAGKQTRVDVFDAGSKLTGGLR